MKTNSIALKYRRYMKYRLNMLRVSGVLMSVICIALVAFQHFNLIDQLWNSISVLYICGFLFTLNGQYQDVCMAKKFAKASRVFATLFYLVTLALLVLIILDKFLIINIFNI